MDFTIYHNFGVPLATPASRETATEVPLASLPLAFPLPSSREQEIELVPGFVLEETGPVLLDTRNPCWPQVWGPDKSAGDHRSPGLAG